MKIYNLQNIDFQYEKFTLVRSLKNDIENLRKLGKLVKKILIN